MPVDGAGGDLRGVAGQAALAGQPLAALARLRLPVAARLLPPASVLRMSRRVRSECPPLALTASEHR
ncbi:hypothetical protein UO65_0822 [Actinokineospora spheciospongiae]|uniref:Uncharacterized protein n=1 Tax=Actinokineospora spheciospongiae TaxID=909613 RepID=W7IU16_9PSEU|nr:hypothetical protein UO65_0822 [Actinokineospora spheciospongiae]